MSMLRKYIGAYVAIEFKNAHVALSNLRNCHVPCHYLFRSHVACLEA